MCAALTSQFGTGADESHHVNGDYWTLQDECASLINTQVSWEYYASIVYTNMAGYFERPSVARPGFAKFFKDQSKEEYDHAQKFISYINKRNGKVKRITIEESPKSEWTSSLEAINDAIKLEHHVYAKLQYIHDVAEQKCQDAHLTDFLVTDFFSEQVNSIAELTKMKTLLEGKSSGSGSTIEFLVDRELKDRKEL